MTLRLGVLDGDGIGKEIVPAARRVVRETDVDATFVDLPVGWDAYEETGSTVPRETIDELYECDGWLLGPCFGGEYPDDDRADGNPSKTLRTEFDLWANVRPVRSYDGIGPEGMDLTIFRQNTEGFLADRNMHRGDGRFMPTEDVAMVVGVFTRKECRRIARAAFAYAAERDMDVTAVTKYNNLPDASGLLLDACEEANEEHPDVGFESYIIDAFAMDLVVNPTDHDVVVTTNLFGDILSDEAAGVVGSLGLGPGLNHGEDHAMGQAIHGAAPDIAGEGVANPTSMILSAAMLLDWLGERDDDAAVAGTAIHDAVTRTINDGVRTTDLGGDASTEAFTDEVVSRL